MPPRRRSRCRRAPPGRLPLYELALMTARARAPSAGCATCGSRSSLPSRRRSSCSAPRRPRPCASCSRARHRAPPVAVRIALRRRRARRSCRASRSGGSRRQSSPPGRTAARWAAGATPTGSSRSTSTACVRGERDVYAAGDATNGPIKQGGVAAQQADAAAAAIAARAGADVEPRPVQAGAARHAAHGRDAALHARRGRAAAAARTRRVSDNALWWPPSKIAGRAWRRTSRCGTPSWTEQPEGSVRGRGASRQKASAARRRGRRPARRWSAGSSARTSVPCSGCRLDQQPAVDQLDPLSHSDAVRTPAVRASGSNPLPSSRTVMTIVLVGLCDSDRDRVGLGVLHRVRDRLLHEPVGRALDVVGETRGRATAGERRGRARSRRRRRNRADVRFASASSAGWTPSSSSDAGRSSVIRLWSEAMLSSSCSTRLLHGRLERAGLAARLGRLEHEVERAQLLECLVVQLARPAPPLGLRRPHGRLQALGLDGLRRRDGDRRARAKRGEQVLLDPRRRPRACRVSSATRTPRARCRESRAARPALRSASVGHRLEAVADRAPGAARSRSGSPLAVTVPAMVPSRGKRVPTSSRPASPARGGHAELAAVARAGRAASARPPAHGRA